MTPYAQETLKRHRIALRGGVGRRHLRHVRLLLYVGVDSPVRQQQHMLLEAEGRGPEKALFQPEGLLFFSAGAQHTHNLVKFCTLQQPAHAYARAIEARPGRIHRSVRLHVSSKRLRWLVILLGVS